MSLQALASYVMMMGNRICTLLYGRPKLVVLGDSDSDGPMRVDTVGR